MSDSTVTAAPGPVELARIWRGGVLEATHWGSVVVVDADGTELLARGDVDSPVLARSALKPLLAATMIDLGLPARGLPLALTAASHSGTPEHQAIVREHLATIGLDETALACPPAWPGNRAARSAATAPTPVAHVCSGKHAGFLATAAVNGWPAHAGDGGVLDPDHPLQRAFMADLAAAAGEPIEAIATDGCGAPVPGLSLRGLARAAATILASDSASVVLDAVAEHPWAIAGPGEPDTRIIDGLAPAVSGERVLAKFGAAGVQLIHVSGVATVVVKVADGSNDVAPATAVAALGAAGVIPRPGTAALASALLPEVLGGGAAAGEVVLTPLGDRR